MNPRTSLVFCIMLTGCGPSTSKITDVNSSTIATLPERIAFLERYVTFRRSYETLDFKIYIADNNAGMMPAPSDHNISIVATVPEAELSEWIGKYPPIKPSDLEWLKTLPTTLDLGEVTEWYGTGGTGGGRLIGLDRAKHIVVFRDLKM